MRRYHHREKLPLLLLIVIAVGMLGSGVHTKELRPGDEVRLPDTPEAAEAAAAGINCPSVTERFRPSSTVKCDGCHVIAVALTYRLVRDRQLFDEATDGLCDDMLQSVLRQKVNGRRFWVPPHKSRQDGDMANTDAEFLKELETSKTMTLTGLDHRFGRFPTYHDAWELQVLPCAPYLLKRLCFERLSEFEDDVERCWAKHRPAQKGMQIKADSEEEEALLGCLSNALGCQRDDCVEKAVIRESEKERVRFMKFEGAFGHTKNNYVEDEFTPGLMVKNPYAPGGAKAHKNEMLQRREKERRRQRGEEM